MRALIPALLLSTALAAQTRAHTKSLPRAFAGWDAPEGNWLPLGRGRSFLQTWYHGSSLRKDTITEIGWRTDVVAVAPKTTHKLEIVLSDTTKTFSTLDRTFAKNLGAAPVVFSKMKNVDFPAVNKPTDPNAPAVWIKGDRPFMFTGPHVIVQVDVQTESYRYIDTYHVDSYFQEASIHGKTGKSCGKGVLNARVEKGVWTLELSGLPPQAPGIFMIGFDHVSIGVVPLPLDLSGVGMKGCSLNVDSLLIRTRIANASGVAAFRLPVPASGSEPIVVHAQCVELDKTKPAGLATSNAVHSILSDKNLSNYLYNWSRDGAVAEYGPFPNNRGAVLLWK